MRYGSFALGNVQENTLLFGSVLKMLGSFGTADFSDRLDMLTMPALRKCAILCMELFETGYTSSVFRPISTRDSCRTPRL